MNSSENPAPSLPPNMGLTPLIEEGKREQIVAEAIRLFCEKGYEATSVREIVEAVGVSKPVLYYYFKNKHELFRYIIESSMEPFYKEVFETFQKSDLDFWDKLKAIFELHVDAATGLAEAHGVVDELVE